MDKRVIRAKIDLMLSSPFWGSLATRLQLKDWDGDTFATNGKYIFVPAQKYYKDFTFKHIIFVIAHETWHCGGGHIFRMRERQLLPWNAAADYATNDLLHKNGFDVHPASLLDEKYAGMTAEKIYALLFQENEQKQKGKGKGGEGEGEDGDGSGGGMSLPDFAQDLKDPGKGKPKDGKDGKNQVPDSGMDPKELEQEWKESVMSAARIAKGRGMLPGGLEEYINEVLFPKVPWQQVLYRYLQSAKGNSDYTTYPFNRRHIWREMYLPSMRGEMIEMIVGMDVSGSVGHDDLVRYFSEIRGIASLFGSYTIHFFQCDTKIHKYEVLTEDDEIPTIAVGRGGTAFEPVFEKIEDEQLQDLPVVYFTDLDGSFPQHYDGDGVFWLIRKDQNRCGHDVPFGEIIEIDD